MIKGSSISDIEIISLLNDIMESLIGNKFTIIINFRQTIINIVKSSGVSDDKVMNVAIILDKLDKKSWDELLIEFEKNDITKDIYDRSYTLYASLKDITNVRDMYDTLYSLGIIDDSYDDSVKCIVEYIMDNGLTNFTFNPFLARGMHYYTGIIFEAAYTDKEVVDLTISSGGRYNNMIGKFSNNGDVPAIGLSLGIKRLAKIIDVAYDRSPPKYDVYVATVEKISTAKRMTVISKLRKLGNVVAYSHHASPKMREHLDFALENDIKYLIIIGENKVRSKSLTLKTLATKTQQTLPEDDVYALFKKM